MKIAINGFGRIGRLSAKTILAYPELEIVAVNDLTDTKTLAHLFKHDSTYGQFEGEIKASGTDLIINNQVIKVLSEKDPANLPWENMKIDLVIESTGRFTDREEAKKHIEAGAKKVVISAPADNSDITIVIGVNEESYDPAKHNIISMASCTTNCLTPVAKILQDKFGIKKATMNTVHSFTMDQVLQDSPHKDLRRARSALQSIIPTTTGATKATAEVIPELKGKMEGLSLRVPTSTVSIVDFVAEVEKETTLEEINQAMKDAASDDKMKGIFDVSDEPLVSADYKANSFSSIVDLSLTQVVGGNLIRVIAWYDNEWGYSCRVADLCKIIKEKGI
jgi:glyceraldehyde 3-phosphate dehydrogenase